MLGGEGCLRWVFGVVGKQLSDIDVSALSEKTSLQRAIKKLYLSGEALGEGYGIYKENDSAWNIKLGKYRHYKGGEYEVIAIGRNSETLEDTVIYRALYGDGGVWVRPAYMWCQRVMKDGTAIPRFQYIGD